MIERLFHLQARGATVGGELRAGTVTFLTMAYILVVNPQILGQAGMPAADVAFATAVAAAVATAVMGLWAGYPFALAPGMGLNAYFTFGVVLGLGLSWQVALAAVFVEGVLFLLLAVTGVRASILRSIPRSLELAVTAGIGLFLAIIGLVNGGVVVDHPVTLVTLGEPSSDAVVLTVAGIAVTAALATRRIEGAILWGILVVAGAAWALGMAELPERIVALPALPTETFLALDFRGLMSAGAIGAVLAFLFVDLFDTAGTLIGVGRLGGFVDDDGELPRADRAFAADAVGTIVGSTLGTSTVTSYVESATGVQEGGRTGLTAQVVAGWFLLSLFFVPVLTAIPPVATAPALVVVGALMMRAATDIEWSDPADAVPAFLAIAAMPLTYSIANGIALGVVTFVSIRALSGRWREVHPVLAVVALALVAYYGLR